MKFVLNPLSPHGVSVLEHHQTVVTVPGGGGAHISDEAYGSTWDGVTTVAPSKNAVYDKIESLSSVYNVRDYGAVGDGQIIENGAISAGAAVLTSASNPFVSSDVGKIVNIQDALNRSTSDFGGISSGSPTLTLNVASQGNYNATTNNPSLADGTGTAGWYYRVSTPGTRDLGSGPQVFELGDYVVYDGAVWHRRDGYQDMVFSPRDVGKPIKVAGAGVAGADLLTTVLTYIDSKTVTLNTNASTTVTDNLVTFGVLPLSSTISGFTSAGQVTISDNAVWGVSGKEVFLATDDTDAYTSAGEAATVNGGIIKFSAGKYLLGSGALLYSNTTIAGDGRGATTLYADAGMVTPMFAKEMTEEDFLHDWTMQDLTIEGNNGLAVRGVLIDSSISNVCPFYSLLIDNVEFKRCHIGLYHAGDNLNADFYVWNLNVNNCRFEDNAFGYIYSGVYSEWITDCYFANNYLCSLMTPGVLGAPTISGPSPGSGPATFVKIRNVEVQQTEPDYEIGTDHGILVSTSSLQIDHLQICQTSQTPLGVTIAEPSLDCAISNVMITDTGGGVYLNSVDVDAGGTFDKFVLHALGQKTNWASSATRQMPINILKGAWRCGPGKIAHYGESHIAPPHAVTMGGLDENNITLAEFNNVTVGAGAYARVITNYISNPSFEGNNHNGWTFTGTGTPTINSVTAKYGTKSMQLVGTSNYVATYEIADIPPTRLFSGAHVATVAQQILVAFWYNGGTPTVELTHNSVSYGSEAATTWSSGWQRYYKLVTLQDSSNPLVINISVPDGATILFDGFQAVNAGGIWGKNGGLVGGAPMSGYTDTDPDPLDFFDGSNTSSSSIHYAWTGSANASPSTKTYDAFETTSSDQDLMTLRIHDCFEMDLDNNYSVLSSLASRVEETISTDTTAAAEPYIDYVYICTAALTLTLPTAVGNTSRYTVKYTGSATVTIATIGSEEIDGASTFLLTEQYDSVNFVSSGTNWYIESVYSPAVTVTNAGNSTDNAIARFNGTSGILLQNSGVVIDDSNNITGVNDLSVADEAYGTGWNGSVEVPTKNAVYDKTEAVLAGSSGGLTPVDYGFLAANMPIGVLTGGNSLTSNGLVFVMKLRTDVPITVTNLHIFVSSAGSGLTSGQNFGALYDASKNLLAQTTDQTTPWGSTGMKTMALTSSQAVAAGYFYVALWSNGTTRPTIRSAANNSSAINGVLSTANSLWATADSSITTTAPSTLGAFTADSNARWVGVS